MVAAVPKLQGGSKRATAWFNAALDAAALGLLDDDALDLVTTEFYRRSRLYESDAMNARGLFEWERLAIDEHFPKEGRVLITSAGGGREALALLERGWNVTALECTDSLADGLVRRLEPFVRSGRARTLCAPPDEVPGGGDPFDAAIVGWGGYTHMISRERRVRFLERLRGVLKPGAPALVSFHGTSRGHGRAARAASAIANLSRGILRRRPVETGETLSPGALSRRFVPGEVSAEMRDAGFAGPVEKWAEDLWAVARVPRG